MSLATRMLLRQMKYRVRAREIDREREKRQRKRGEKKRTKKKRRKGKKEKIARRLTSAWSALKYNGRIYAGNRIPAGEAV